MRIAFDTNILAYLAGVDRVASDGPKIDRSRATLAALAGRATLIVPVQALGELFVVLVRAGAPREAARDIVLRFRQTFAVTDTQETTLLSALDLVVAHRLQLWDSLILSAAADAGCGMLLSEDMQAGFVWRGVTVLDPLTTAIEDRFTL